MILDEILSILKNKSNNKAYEIGNECYTYGEFYQYVSNIYTFLLRENKEKKTVVVFGHKEIYMKATFLACSFAGITYVPIDINVPKDRIELILNQVNPGIIVGDLKSNCKCISKKEINEIMQKENLQEINTIFMKPDDIYYIIFTSGSTGIPKGVKISYNNLNSCINWLKEIANINKEVVLNQANFSFDLSVADIYLSLITESNHFIVDSDEMMDYKKVFYFLKKSNASIAVMTPSYADLLLLDKDFNQELMPKLKKIIFCGERLKNNTVEKLYNRFEKLEIINCYGPTECTFAVTSFEVPRNYKDEIPVGKAKKDVKIYIVDEQHKELDNEQKGEILITGKSVANGYLKNIENKSFITFKEEKAYLTGDIGYIKDGLLYYIQRKDKQIKYKGYRIELSDIENNIQNLSYIEKVVVVAKKNNEGRVINILAFVKTKQDINIIKQDLKRVLPEYMIPKIRIVEKFPINNNGKCDEKNYWRNTKWKI